MKHLFLLFLLICALSLPAKSQVYITPKDEPSSSYPYNEYDRIFGEVTCQDVPTFMATLKDSPDRLQVILFSLESDSLKMIFHSRAKGYGFVAVFFENDMVCVKEFFSQLVPAQ